MSGMTPSQARVIDPILTTVARGYKNAAFVGSLLFPYVPVPQRGGKIITFGKEDFKLYGTARAPGANTKRVSYGYAGEAYALEQHALEGVVPFEIMEEASAVPGIDMGKGAVTRTQNIIALRLEYAQARLATDATKYDAGNKSAPSGTDKWENDASDPIAQVEAAKEAVRAKIGRRPDAAVISAAVWKSLKNHPKVIDRIKYTSRDNATPELVAALFGLKKVAIGDAVYADDKGKFTDVWGKSVVLGYVEVGSLAEMGTPAYGYTYQLMGYPMVEQPYPDRNAKSWIYPVTDEVRPVIAGADAGFLIQNAVS